MRFRLTPRSLTLDDRELYKFEFFREFRWISQISDAITYKRMMLNQYCQRQRCKQLNAKTLCSFRSFAVDFFARGLHTRIAVARLP